MKKRNITYKHILAILFSAVILVFFITICERFVRSAILKQNILGEIRTETAYGDASKTLTDWSKIYPFKNEKKNETSEDAEKEKFSFFGNIENLAKQTEEKIDYYTTKLLAMRLKFIELNAKFSNTIGNELISGVDDIVVMADGNLTYYPAEYDTSDSAENAVKFSEKLKNNGIEFLYVQCPSKVDFENNYLPGGIVDYDNQKSDNLIKILDENKVNYLDLRESMHNQKMNFTNSFYKTDHHWKVETGFWASGEIAKKITDLNKINYATDKFNINDYDQRIYENFSLGSLGKQVTLAYVEPEDASVIVPKFQTDFTVNYYDGGIKKGTFQETMLDMSVFDKIDYYNTSTYSAYLGGVSPVVTITNNNAPNDTNVLVIGDSFSHCVVPYLATGVKKIDKLDLRYFNGSVESFIEKNRPDIVVVMYYPGSLNYSKFSTMNFD